jgi:hypothetical protein
MCAKKSVKCSKSTNLQEMMLSSGNPVKYQDIRVWNNKVHFIKLNYLNMNTNPVKIFGFSYLMHNLGITILD